MVNAHHAFWWPLPCILDNYRASLAKLRCCSHNSDLPHCRQPALVACDCSVCTRNILSSTTRALSHLGCHMHSVRLCTYISYCLLDDILSSNALWRHSCHSNTKLTTKIANELMCFNKLFFWISTTYDFETNLPGHLEVVCKIWIQTPWLLGPTWAHMQNGIYHAA